jgi:spectrin beta
LELAEIRKQRLLDALALYKLYNDAEGVEQWIAEKVRPHACEPVFYDNWLD